MTYKESGKPEVVLIECDVVAKIFFSRSLTKAFDKNIKLKENYYTFGLYNNAFNPTPSTHSTYDKHFSLLFLYS